MDDPRRVGIVSICQPCDGGGKKMSTAYWQHTINYYRPWLKGSNRIRDAFDYWMSLETFQFDQIVQCSKTPSALDAFQHFSAVVGLSQSWKASSAIMALDAFQNFTAVERLRCWKALSALAALANTVDVRRAACERVQATKMKKLSKIKQGFRTLSANQKTT